MGVIMTHYRNGLGKIDLVNEALSMMIAGSNSTATAMRMCLLSVITTPGVLGRLRREIDELGFERGRDCVG